MFYQPVYLKKNVHNHFQLMNNSYLVIIYGLRDLALKTSTTILNKKCFFM